jgi:hypothetical protein
MSITIKSQFNVVSGTSTYCEIYIKLFSVHFPLIAQNILFLANENKAATY